MYDLFNVSLKLSNILLLGQSEKEDEVDSQEDDTDEDQFVTSSTSQCPISLVKQGWDDQSLNLLITLWGERKIDFYAQSSKKKQLWADIAAALNVEGYRFTWTDSRAAWKVLLSNYEVALERGDVTTCHFFEEMTHVHSSKPEELQFGGTKRPLVDGNNFRTLITDDGTTVLLGESSESSESANKRQRSGSCMFPQNSELSDAIEVLGMVQTMNEDLSEMKRERLKLTKEIHDESTQMLSRLLTLMEQKKDKKPYVHLPVNTIDDIGLPHDSNIDALDLNNMIMDM